MAELKTRPTDNDVLEFIEKIDHPTRRKDAFVLLEMMKEITGESPVLWGESIIGFGRYAYTYRSGHSGEWFLIGFSPRKTSMSLYLMSGFDIVADDLKRLGKHKLGKSCLYINKLDDVDMDVLKTILKKSYEYMKRGEKPIC